MPHAPSDSEPPPAPVPANSAAGAAPNRSAGASDGARGIAPAGDVPHIVVLGAGFGGLATCRALTRRAAGGQPFQITLVDRQNHHLFQPLLYQVAMAGLSAPDIAHPIRSVFRGRDEVMVVMGEVKSIDVDAKTVDVDGRPLTYDSLVVAVGGQTSYFGNDGWEVKAPGLKSLEDAMRIRRRVLAAYERAETSQDPQEQRRLTTVVVVGGGATGVELAGAMAELSRQVFRRDFRRIDPTRTRVILVEGGDRVLASYSEALSASAKSQLEDLGVEVRLGAFVTELEHGSVTLSTGERIGAANVLWGAGVKGHPLGAQLGAPLARGGRVEVEPDLSLADRPEVFVVGDLAHVLQPDGAVVPSVAPAAGQMGKHVARTLASRLKAGTVATPDNPGAAFKYLDKGSMATIGRKRAVAAMPGGKVELKGLPAWLAWLLVHLVFLVGFRNRLAVLMHWTYSYLTFKRGARILVRHEDRLSGTARSPYGPQPVSDAPGRGGGSSATGEPAADAQEHPTA